MSYSVRRALPAVFSAAVTAVLLVPFEADAQSAPGLLDDFFPLIKGSPGEPGSPQGYWLAEERADLDGVPASERDAWTTTLVQLGAIIRDSPALVDLAGFYPRLVVGLDWSAQPLPQGGLSVGVFPAETIVASTGRRKDEWQDYTPGGFSLFFNRFPPGPSGRSEGLVRPGWLVAQSADMFRLPPPEREIAGFPVLAGYLIVTTPDKPRLFLPVSRRSALEAAVAAAEAQIAVGAESNALVAQLLAEFNSPEMLELRRMAIEQAAAVESDSARAAEARARAEGDDAEQERQIREMAGASPDDSPATVAARSAVATLGSELAALSSAEGEAPAYIRTAPETFLGDEIVAVGVEGAVPLMRFNPDFFDPSRRNALQLIWMSVDGRADWEGTRTQPMQASIGDRVAIAVVEQTDWRRVAALMR